MKIKATIFALVMLLPSILSAADTNTNSTVVTDKAPPTASAPSIVINNSDICKSAASASIQNNVTSSQRNNVAFPDHIKRVLDLYKNY